jgi:polyisoprenoid-binding protein YceI
MFKRYAVAVMVLTLLTGVAYGQSWNVDKAHSSVGFSVRHMVISTVSGNFGDYSADINFDGKDMSKATVNATVQMASVNTENDRRDGHLRSPDFFDVEKYPTMIFKSKKITVGPDNTFTMVGDLTIRDVTKEVTFTGQLNGIIDDPMGNTRAGLQAETTINRQDFHVSWENKLKDGALVVSNDVKIQLRIEMVKAT